MNPDNDGEREVLNGLIEMMVASANGYGRAARMAKDPTALTRLENTSVQRWNLAADLHAELARLGEVPRAAASGSPDGTEAAPLSGLGFGRLRSFGIAAAEKRIAHGFETALSGRKLSPHVLFAIMGVYVRFKACRLAESGQVRSTKLHQGREPDAGAAV